MALLQNNYTQWLAVGLLLGVGFLEPLLWLLGLVGIGYFLYLALETEVKARTKLIGAGLAWTIKYLCSLLWFWSAYPIDWLAVELGGIQIALIFAYWFTASLWLGFGGVYVVGISLLLKRFGSLTKTYLYILMPLLWVSGELFGSIAFSVITFGPGSTITPAFSFGYVGYLVGEHNLFLQLSQFGGVYFLSMVAVAIPVTFLLIKKVQKTAPVLLVALFLYGTGFLFSPATDTTYSEAHYVITIDTQFDVKELRDRNNAGVNEELNKAVASALEFEPDYIILPEDSRLFDQNSSVGTAKARFQLEFNNPQVILIDSGRYNQPGVEGSYLQTFIYDGDNPVGRVQKRYLVPQGEYMPTLYVNTLSLLGYGHIVDRVSQSISFRVGTESDQSVLSDQTPGVLFCFESVNPLGVREIMNERSSVPFIAHPISHAWFHEPQQLWSQLDTMLQIQAIWNGQYIISSGGHVAGALYTPEGSIIQPQTIASGDGWTIRESYIPKQ
tara:strand:- start:4333 stop:5826 length:1494 start_codon:yes stop_codon:yes gene_type:complete